MNIVSIDYIMIGFSIISCGTLLIIGSTWLYINFTKQGLDMRVEAYKKGEEFNLFPWKSIITTIGCLIYAAWRIYG